MEKQDVIKHEKVGYLKSKLNMMQGDLYLTTTSISLTAHKTAVGGLGLIGFLVKKHVEKNNDIFNLDFNSIIKFEKGAPQGLNKNIIELTDKENNKFRIAVKDATEWENLLKSKIKQN